MLKKMFYVVVGALGLLSSFAASATSTGGIDVSEAVASITDAQTALATIGGAILLLAGVALAYKWAKAAFFS